MSVSSLPRRLLTLRVAALRGAFLEVHATTDFNDYDHGRSVERLAEEIDTLEGLVHRLYRMKESQR